MNIQITEFKKIIMSPIIIFLLVIFNLFNLFIIYSNSTYVDDLNVTRDISKKFGCKIDNNMIIGFKKYYDKNTKNKFSSNKSVLEKYKYAIENMDDFYKNLDIIKIGEGEINKYGLKEEAANTVRDEYKKFNKRFKQLVKNKEYKNIFFLNKICTSNGLLFNTLFKSFIFELMILSVLIVSHLVNYEFENKVQDLIYTTKRGRNIIWDKLKILIIVDTVFCIVIIGVGILVYFITFNHFGFFKVPISNYFNFNEVRQLPNMCWFNMSFIQYVLSGICIIYICTLLFSKIAFFISIYVKNNYIVFFIFVIIFGLSLLGIPFLSLDSNAVFINSFTPFMLIMNPKLWFMEGGAFFTFKYYEVITIGVWGIITSYLCILSIKKFKQTDIY